MKKLMFAIIAALSICAALFAGGKTEKQEPARYELTEIGSNAGIDYLGRGICVTPDGLLLIYQATGEGSSFVYLDSGGRKVRELQTEIAYPLVSFTVDRAGTIAVLAQDYIFDEARKNVISIKRRAYLFSSTGQKLREVDLPDLKRAEGQWSMDTAVADGKGTLYVLAQGRVEVLDPATGTVRPLGSQSYRGMAIDEAGNLILARVTPDTYDVWIEKLRGSDSG